MPFQLHVEREGEPVAGDIVLRRTQAAGRDHHVRTRQREPERVGDPLDVVAHRLMVHHVDADLGELLRDPLRVGVRDLTEQDLRADPDDLRPHRVLTLPEMFRK